MKIRKPRRKSARARSTLFHGGPFSGKRALLRVTGNTLTLKFNGWHGWYIVGYSMAEWVPA